MTAGGIGLLQSLNGDVIVWLNQFSQLSAGFNRFVNYVSSSPLTKGIPVMGLLWYFWFRDVDNAGRTRRLIVATLIGCFFALFAARILNNAITHPRPISTPALHFQSLAGVQPVELQAMFDQNSFPSDHATLFFSLATGIFLLSRRAGVAAIAYVIVGICLPRMYLGLHYPGDILAGALLGVGFVLLFASGPVRRRYQHVPDGLLQSNPALFQAALFMLSVEICLMFDDIRRLLKGLSRFFG